VAIVDGKIRCSKCRETKELSLFPKAVAKSGSGCCKLCARQYSDAWRERNKERVLASKRARYAADPQSAAKAKAYRDVRIESYTSGQKTWWAAQTAEKKKHYALTKNYGMSIEQYDDMLKAQGGGCAICGAETNKNGKSLFVDHCHDTGRVRGILCYKCNTGLGSFLDNPELIQKALSYLT